MLTFGGELQLRRTKKVLECGQCSNHWVWLQGFVQFVKNSSNYGLVICLLCCVNIIKDLLKYY